MFEIEFREQYVYLSQSGARGCEKLIRLKHYIVLKWQITFRSIRVCINRYTWVYKVPSNVLQGEWGIHSQTFTSYASRLLYIYLWCLVVPIIRIFMIDLNRKSTIRKNRIDWKIDQKKIDVLADRWSVFYWLISFDFMVLRAP